jgi:hypothetical protein
VLLEVIPIEEFMDTDIKGVDVEGTLKVRAGML